jgi:hypothetical protein
MENSSSQVYQTIREDLKCPISLEEFLQSDQVDPLTGEQKEIWDRIGFPSMENTIL